MIIPADEVRSESGHRPSCTTRFRGRPRPESHFAPALHSRLCPRIALGSLLQSTSLTEEAPMHRTQIPPLLFCFALSAGSQPPERDFRSVSFQSRKASRQREFSNDVLRRRAAFNWRGRCAAALVSIPACRSSFQWCPKKRSIMRYRRLGQGDDLRTTSFGNSRARNPSLKGGVTSSRRRSWMQRAGANVNTSQRLRCSSRSIPVSPTSPASQAIRWRCGRFMPTILRTMKRENFMRSRSSPSPRWKITASSIAGKPSRF